MACPMTYNGVNLSRSDSQYTRNTRNATNPSHISRFFLLRNIQGNLFENANICISPTFQETVGRHLRPSLTVFAMGTLNQFNSNIFSGFNKQYSTCKNIKTLFYTCTYSTVALTPFSFFM